MRGVHFYLLCVITFVVWLVAMAFLPTRTVEQSVAFLPGIFLLGLLFFTKIGWLEMYRFGHRSYGPGFSTTLASEKPVEVVRIADFVNSPGLRDYNIYKLGGTFYLPKSGGGRDGGYAAIPVDLDRVWEGEECQREWNVALHYYRENPDVSRGERDIESLPAPIYESITHLKGFHPKTFILFGRLPFEENGAKILNRNLEAELDYAWKYSHKLEEQIKDVLSASSKYATVQRYISESFGPNERKTLEKKGPFDFIKRGEDDER